MVDHAKLDQFIGQLLSDLGGAVSVPMVRIGDALGLYKALRAGGPMTPKELADKVGVSERYLREWLAHQAASNYLSYDADTRRFALPEEQAMIFAVEDSPVYMMSGFDLMAALTDNQRKVEAAFGTGSGVAWGDQSGCMFCAVARFFPTGYHNNLIGAWAPCIDGVVDKLERGSTGRRHRLWPRLVDGHDGQGFPALTIDRLRFPPGLDRGRSRPRGRTRRGHENVRFGCAP